MANGATTDKPAQSQTRYYGFNSTYQERTPVELTVIGNIPEWTAGVLYRIGMGANEIETKSKGTYKIRHWFDSMAIAHRFEILPPDTNHRNVRVVYNSRSTSDGLIKKVQETGILKGVTFGAKYDPCTSFFQKAMSLFQANPYNGKPDEAVVSVTLSTNFPGVSKKAEPHLQKHASGIQALVARTDANVFQALDPETLEPIGIASQKILHPDLKGQLSGAHAKSDPVTGDVYNYNLQFGRTATYRMFHVSAETGKTSILATIPGADPAYIHSIFLSQKYVILCVWNSFFAGGGAKILWTKNMIDALQDYDDTRPARWYVVDRRLPAEGGKGLIATYESEPFFAFHSVNAYDESSSSGTGTDIVADVIAYDNLDVLKSFYMENLLSQPDDGQPKSAFNLSYKRFRLPSIPGEPLKEKRLKAISEFEPGTLRSLELPALNPKYLTRPHRYVYGVSGLGSSNFLDNIIKLNLHTRDFTVWGQQGHSPSEPIFIQRPPSTTTDKIDSEEDDSEEDDGVLLSVVLDGSVGRSYLLVLDAKDLKEIGRAEVNGPIGLGLHGTHVSSLNKETPLHY